MDKFIKLENSNHGTKTNNYGDQSEVIAVCKNKTKKNKPTESWIKLSQ